MFRDRNGRSVHGYALPKAAGSPTAGSFNSSPVWKKKLTSEFGDAVLINDTLDNMTAEQLLIN